MTNIIETKMAGLGVIVENSTFSASKETGKDGISCSGIHLGSGWILTHGTIISDLVRERAAQPFIDALKSNYCATNKKESLLRSLLDDTKSKFQVLFDERNHKNMESLGLLLESSRCSAAEYSKTLDIKEVSRTPRLPCTSSSETPSYYGYPAHISMVFIQPKIMEILASLMPATEGWKFTEDKESSYAAIDSEAVLLASFVLLKVVSWKNSIDQSFIAKPFKGLVDSVERFITCADINKGMKIYVESSPFGSLSPSVFLNSLSEGIVSNVCGREKELYLTDARCIMGSEGAPVYSLGNEKPDLCGIVISPFCWKQGEWLGLCLLASAKSVIHSLLWCLNYNFEKQQTYLRTIKEAHGLSQACALKRNKVDTSDEGLAEAIEKTVVGVSCGGGWGSGIVISSSPGIVLTCAHVIQPASFGRVEIVRADGLKDSGEVIYHTHPTCFVQEDESGKTQRSSMWDLAIIQTTNPLPYAASLASQLPSKGSPVFVAGHGIFSPMKNPTPILSQGIISKIITVEASSIEYPNAISDARNERYETIQSKCEVSRHHDTCSKNYIEPNAENPNLSASLVKLNVCDANAINEGELSKDQAMLDIENGVVPVMFQTTCSVYAGNSGGPVVFYHPQLGPQVVGVMVCNTKDLTNKATFPEVNLAVPVPAIKKIITSYILSGNRMLLNYLGAECPMVSQLWGLALTPQSHL